MNLVSSNTIAEVIAGFYLAHYHKLIRHFL